MDIKSFGKGQMFLGFSAHIFADRLCAMEIMAFVSVLLAVTVLLWMGWIDLKLWILPNELVIALAFLALPFHYALDWYYGGWLFFVIGAAAGSGALLAIRAVANRIYQAETLGLGDVKLMAAAGLWLGPEGVLMAMSVGAFGGIIHAMIIVAHKRFALGQAVSLNRMALPAGPGFIAGIILAGLWYFKDLPG